MDNTYEENMKAAEAFRFLAEELENNELRLAEGFQLFQLHGVWIFAGNPRLLPMKTYSNEFEQPGDLPLSGEGWNHINEDVVNEGGASEVIKNQEI